MTTMTTAKMSLALAPRSRRPAMLRRLADGLHAALNMTAQQRAETYVAHMPIAMIAD
ncbi:hypothetical protein [Mycobacterium vicinigordonae]|uniref:Uncharacterized protein n=1 Tax=Mycobacterium vicinigordonae TaxID=1719132 RepID=A0A7D6DUF7_9MYCO|nr:hypothetical protein [Mycobacterium vicinigordonae]QLL05044.1 hypothetical protein H0P51_01625 [Mycobacterium vicinigordonae]